MDRPDRRTLLVTAGAGLASLATFARSTHAQSQTPPRGGGHHEPQAVTPTEDLMQEHGLLDRALLAYETIAQRLETNAAITPDPLRGIAEIVRDFVHEYHERSEENYIFPRAQQQSNLAPIVLTLRTQHDRGRIVTTNILAACTPAAFGDAAQRTQIVRNLRAFVRMYRPHAAREDTVIFPAVREMFTPHDWHELGERFEDEEHRRFGAPGFEGMVARAATIEQQLGIYDLAQYTP